MFGLPLWVFSVIIQILSYFGFFSAAQKLAIKVGMTIVHDVENAKVEYSYPTGKNGEHTKKIYAKGPPNANFNRGDADDKGSV